MAAPPGHLALVAVGLANLIALLSGGLHPPFEPGLPPCALHAVCPPAWLPPDPESCPPCPELEAAPCPVVQPVCPVVESSKPEPEVDPWGWVAAAAPGNYAGWCITASAAAVRKKMIARRHLPPLAVAEEWCAELPVGSLIRVSYDGEATDHTRIVLWPCRRRDARGRLRGKTTYWVLSADGDVWEEDLSGKNPATGPSGGSVLDQTTGDPPDGRRLYRFRLLPSLDEILERAAECRETMLGRGQREFEGAERVMLPDGVERAGREYFPWLIGERPWVLAEPLTGMPVGTVVDPLPEGVVRAGSQALAHLSGGGRWARLEQVDANGIVEWAAGRLEELRGLLGAAPLPAPAVSVVGGAETPPPWGPTDRPGPDPLAAKLGLADESDARQEVAPEEPNNDVRTLWVDWDEQGERRKDFRRAVAESSEVEWDHHRLPSDRTCLHACKTMMNLNGSPRALLERFLREKGISPTDRVPHELRVLCDILEEAGEFDQLNLGGLACLEVAALRLNLLVDARKTSGTASYSNAKYLSPLTEVDQLAAPGLRSHVPRRAKEECEQLQGDEKAEAVAASASSSRAPPRETRGRQPRPDCWCRAEVHELASGAIDSLNWLAGWGPSDAGPPRPLDSIWGKRAGIVQWVASEALRRRAAAPSPCPSREAALSALLKGCSIYDASGSPRNLASFVRDRVSLPPSIVGCRQVEDSVGEAGRTYLEENHKRMRRPIHEIDFDSLPTPYFDPLLKRNKKKYRSFLKDLTSRGLFLATLKPSEQAGFFFVKKSDGHKMRMIVGARRASAWFNVPPSVQLLSCEGFGRVEVRLPEGVTIGSARAEELLGKFRLFLGMTDVKGCFYRMRIPLSLAKFFSLPAAPAHVLGLAGGAYVYVDNLGVITLSETIAQEARARLWGPSTKLDLELMRSCVGDGRFWKVYVGLGVLLARGCATGRALEMLLGRCAFCGLALRGSLSCWRASYRFIQRRYLEPARLWPEVVKEVKMFRGLLVLMVQDWWRPWNHCVLQTDASEIGWGMAQSFWPLRVVEEVGGLPERARSRSEQARALSMGPKRLRGLSALVAREPALPTGAPTVRTSLETDGGAAEGDGSSSGSDSVIEHLGRGRVRVRQLRARRAQMRAKLCADAILAAQEAGVGLLETVVVTQPTQADAEIDELFCNYLTENYLQGEQSSDGDQTMAALVSANPDFGVQTAELSSFEGAAVDLDCSEALALLREAAGDLGVAPVTLYQMRHSGASIDLAKGWRNLTSAQRRGEWTQAKSMHRYERSSRLGSSNSKLAPSLRAVCEQAERQFTQILTGQPFSIPVMLERPLASRLWHAAEMCELSHCKHVFLVELDQCQYGVGREALRQMVLEGRDLAREECRRRRLPPELGAHLGEDPTTMVDWHGDECGLGADVLEAARRRLRGKRPQRNGARVLEVAGDEESTRPVLVDGPLEDAGSVLLVAELHAGGGLGLGDELSPSEADVAVGPAVIGRRADGRPVLCERVAISGSGSWRAQAFENARRVAASALGPAEPPSAADGRPIDLRGSLRAPSGEAGGASTPREGRQVEQQAEDVRTLAVERNEQGVRLKEWRRAVGESSEETLDSCELRGGPAGLEVPRVLVLSAKPSAGLAAHSGPLQLASRGSSRYSGIPAVEQAAETRGRGEVPSPPLSLYPGDPGCPPQGFELLQLRRCAGSEPGPGWRLEVDRPQLRLHHRAEELGDGRRVHHLRASVELSAGFSAACALVADLDERRRWDRSIGRKPSFVQSKQDGRAWAL
ncbi:unnamed protein product [Prorocentrum cordatum]|uniref:START domain-containing protein n=1 Tax=Prorocentrum cordatum TaxID=2364126 RepID=A0ABN9UWG1_9DINO|nr:unnamed protein product [Polarella glacialis]